MGLQLNKELPFGVSATYWKIASINIKLFKDYLNEAYTEPMYNEVEVVLFGYINRERRDENKMNICSETFRCSISIGENINGDIRPLLYNSIKLNPEWYSAVDI